MSDRDPPDDTVIVETELADAPEKVWRALTEPQLVAEWLKPDAGASIDCELIKAEPHRLLRYRWREGDDDNGAGIESVVTFTLARTPAGGTRLRIVHTGFAQLAPMAMAA
jgi:uncharacterized protein YndB with AHSA1/START domain